MNQHTHTAGVAGGAPTEHVVNVNDVIDNATFKPFHWQVLFWCLLIIIFTAMILLSMVWHCRYSWSSGH